MKQTSIKQTAKEQLDELIREYVSLNTEEEKARFSLKMKALLAAQSDIEREALSEAFIQSAQSAVTSTDTFIEEATMRIALAEIGRAS
jgi:ElaB/YqjD/DUF883 family membrane-anchored ribosome-binding protein